MTTFPRHRHPERTSRKSDALATRDLQGYLEYDAVKRALSRPAIRRMAFRAGVARIGDVDDTVRLRARDFLLDLLKNALAYTDHTHRRTISAQDVVRALQHLIAGKMRLYGYDG